MQFFQGELGGYFEEYVIDFEFIRLFKTFDEDSFVFVCRFFYALYCFRFYFRLEDFIFKYSDRKGVFDLCQL